MDVPLPVSLECPDDAMDYPPPIALRRKDQFPGQISGLDLHSHRLHEMIAEWLGTIQELRCANQELRRQNEILAAGLAQLVSPIGEAVAHCLSGAIQYPTVPFDARRP